MWGSSDASLRRALEILNVKPEEAVVVGDDVQTDVVLPKRLGMKVILLDRGGNMKCEHADAIVSDLDRAVETVIKQFNRN